MHITTWCSSGLPDVLGRDRGLWLHNRRGARYRDKGKDLFEQEDKSVPFCVVIAAARSADEPVDFPELSVVRVFRAHPANLADRQP